MTEQEVRSALKVCLVVIVCMWILGGLVAGSEKNRGYKQGQLDYAAGKIEYTIIDGRTIQYLDGTK